jgi:hypothetical protein
MRNALAYVPIVDPTPEQDTSVQLEPEILLPEQLENLGRRWMRPEHRLMLACSRTPFTRTRPAARPTAASAA